LIPVIIMGVVVELLVRNVPNSFKYKHEKIENSLEDIEVLILGSSHTLYGVNPKFFKEETFNLSHVSQTLDLDYQLLSNYIEKIPKLKKIIIRLSYTSLFEKLEFTDEDWRLKNYTIYYNIPIHKNVKYYSELLSVKLKNNIDIIYDYYINDEDLVNCTEKGWGLLKKHDFDFDIEKSGKISAHKHTIEDKFLYEENLQLLNRIIQICKEKNIEVLLFTPPAYDSYRDNLDLNQLNIMIATGNEVANNYSNCSYYNLLEDDLFTKKDFFDADHLNKDGAEKLSKLLKSL